MSLTMPFKLLDWIDDNREYLKPPVCNKQMFESGDFIVQVVGGPNSRTDYHLDEGPELFFQVEGEMLLKTVQDGDFVEIPIREGEIFLLPPRVPHSPQRFKDTVGIVVERKRAPQELDGFMWFCPRCANKLHEEYLHVGGHRERPAARVRAFLREHVGANLQALRHRHAAEIAGCARATSAAARRPPARSTQPTSCARSALASRCRRTAAERSRTFAAIRSGSCRARYRAASRAELERWADARRRGPLRDAARRRARRAHPGSGGRLARLSRALHALRSRSSSARSRTKSSR